MIVNHVFKGTKKEGLDFYHSVRKATYPDRFETPAAPLPATNLQLGNSLRRLHRTATDYLPRTQICMRVISLYRLVWNESIFTEGSKISWNKLKSNNLQVNYHIRYINSNTEWKLMPFRFAFVMVLSLFVIVELLQPETWGTRSTGNLWEESSLHDILKRFTKAI